MYRHIQIIDSTDKALTSLGLHPNYTQDFLEWTKKLCDRFPQSPPLVYAIYIHEYITLKEDNPSVHYANFVNYFTRFYEIFEATFELIVVTPD